MPAYRKIPSIKNIILFFLLTIFLSLPVFSQSLEMPSLDMPEISDISRPDFPAMPEITSSSDGSENFYRPEIPQFGKTKQTSEEAVKTTPKETTLTSAEDSDSLLTNLLYGNNVLSAKDISSLSDYGLFDSLSDLQGTNYSILSQTSSSDVLLRQILLELEDLKKEQSKNSQAKIEQGNEIAEDAKVFKKRSPSVLRFTINGYDLTPSLATVFFSEPEADGTFLMTGDRKYYSDKKNHSETFYLLFKAEKASNKNLNYKITPSVVQDSKNEKSFLYQLSQKSNITASKTGNLVVVHYSENNWNMDLLLDIDCKGNQ